MHVYCLIQVFVSVNSFVHICISLEFSHPDDLLVLRISQAGRSVALLIRKIGI